MKNALRKLIAFVFLLGIAWYIYRDVHNIWNPKYMSSIGLLVAIFAVFWLLVPLVVVWFRIFRRVRRNRRGYAAWLESVAVGGLSPRYRNRRLDVDPSERVWFHEKGTFYVSGGHDFDAVTVEGRIGDVAFPHERRVWRKAQRVHCYFTDRRVLFLGKEVDCDVPFDKLISFRATVGGHVFEVERDGRKFEVAFTMANPLIAEDILRRIMV